MAQDPAPSTTVTVLKVMFFIACSVFALGLYDHALSQKLWPVGKGLWTLRKLKEQPLSSKSEGPQLLRGTIETASPRLSPAGEPTVMYYGWVEDHYRSGRSDTVRVICNVGEDEQLTFRQGDKTLPFEIFHHDEHIALLKKSGFFSSLPMDRVGIDLGPVHSQKISRDQLPDGLQQRCPDGLSPRGTLYYKEARLPLQQEVVVLACPKDGVLRSCDKDAPVPAVLAVSSITRLLAAYAEVPLNWLRGCCVLLAFVLGYLCSILFAASGGEGKR